MATYYIDPSATFDGNGLGPDPAVSPGALGARNIWPDPMANNTYLIKRGTRYRKTSTYLSVGNNVIIDCYGDESLDKPEIYSTDISVTFWVYSSTGARISNIKFAGGTTRSFSIGTLVFDCIITDCDMTGKVDGVTISTSAAWMDGGATPTNMGPVVFRRCTFTYAKFDCLYAQDIANVTWENCQFRFPQQADPGAAYVNGGGDACQLSSNAQTTLNNIKIHACTFENLDGGKHALIVGGDTNSTSTGITITSSTLIGGAKVFSTWVSNVKMRGCKLIAYDDKWNHGNSTSVMFNIANNGSSGLVVSSIIVEGNGIAGDGLNTESTAVASPMTLCNWTIQNCKNNYIVCDSTAGSTVTITNCVFNNSTTTTTAILSISPSWTLVSTYNRYTQAQTGLLLFTSTANTYSSVALAQGAGYETGSTQGDPSITPGGWPFTESPLIGAGVPSTYQKDASDAQYWNPPSIGAYEYVRPRQTATARQTRV